MSTKKNKEVSGFLKGVEKIGNKLPHPAILFFILSLIVVIVSAIAEAVGAPVTYFDAKKGQDVTIKALSLLNADGFRYILNSATKNFTSFAPLGTVLVAMLGIGVADWTGLINTSLKKLLSGVNPRILTAVVVFAGIMSNIASDAGYVVVIPLGAIVFANAGRHPLAGLAAAFAGVSGGFSANLLLGTTDPLLTGITIEALHNAGMDIPLDPTCNWYFMMVSTLLLTVIGTLVTEKIVEKNLGKYTGTHKPDEMPVSAEETKALKLAGISILVMVVLLVIGMFGLPGLPSLAVLSEVDPKTGISSLSNFMHGGLLPVILILFLVPGLVYGKKLGKINNSHDLVKGMTVAMSSMGGYLVLAFFAAQFVSYFGKTNLGTIISVNGAHFLQSIGFTGLPLILSFVVISAFLNLFMGSASAKWAIMAPIFVPMMVNLGLSPALTQVAYRIGDSSTNIITPLMNYFAMIVVFMKKYDEDSGLGTLISIMLPYSIAFLLSWIGLMIIWYVTGLPLGPGAFLTL